MGRPKSKFPEKLRLYQINTRISKSGKEKLNAKLKEMDLSFASFLEKIAQGEFDVVKKL